VRDLPVRLAGAARSRLALANASRAVAYHATRSQLRWRQGAWREVPTQDGVGGVGFLYAVIAFGPQSAWAGGADDGDNDNQLIERYR
jgi:hypothetical protein